MAPIIPYGMTTERPVFHFVLKPGLNGSMYLFLRDDPEGLSHELLATPEPYDQHGALVYIITVVIVYGLCILLMIASVIKKDKRDDSGMSKYMNDLEKISRAERKFHKTKTNFVLKKMKKFNILRSASVPNSIGSIKGLNSKHRAAFPGKVTIAGTPPESRSSTGSEEKYRLLHGSSTATSLESMGSTPSGSPSADTATSQQKWSNNVLFQATEDPSEYRGSPIYFTFPEQEPEVPEKKMPEDKRPSAVTLHTVFEEEDDEDL